MAYGQPPVCQRYGLPVGDARAPVAVRNLSAEETRPLRLQILRPNQPTQAAVYPGDDAPTSRHFGAWIDDRLVGIASLYAEPRAGGPRPGWRLRGMATEPSRRGRGVGRALLQACVDHVAAEGGGELWANARMVAVEFYGRFGFEVVSEQFEIEGIGPHVVMRRLVP
ncbi:MAG: GNAT family N-acetyltransferase [Actinomycetota bacterium]|nr:GNAT family N-acetyltransferase [Actinomycetota bacterium]